MPFGKDQGVIDNVRLIRQDHQGYLWCVVQRKGLLRFDGVQFRGYANDPDDPNSLPNNSIEDMVVDHNGLIWLATQTGMVRFDPATGRFSSVTSQGAQDFICLFEDHQARIWAGTASAGLTFFDAQMESMVTWPAERIQDGYTSRPIAKSEFSRIADIAESAVRYIV